MECLSQEPVLFEDVLCQIHDMVQPAVEGMFTLQDLKRQKSLAGILFNILFNLNKFIAFETRDPFVVRQVDPQKPTHASSIGQQRVTWPPDVHIWQAPLISKPCSECWR